MITLGPRPAFGPLLKPMGAAAGIIVTERTGLRLATVIARKGDRETLASAMRSAFGLDLPAGPKRAVSGETALLGTGPRTWLAVQDGGEGDLAQRLRDALGPAVAVSDQSDGYGVLRLSGPKSRDVLAKGLAVDLHPRAFTPGDVAVTTCSHIGVTIWQVDDAPTYEVTLFRSFAGSFVDWLAESAAEYGLAVGIPF